MRLSSFIFKENHLFIEEDNRSDKVVMVEEELDDIRNLVDLPSSSMKNVGTLK